MKLIVFLALLCKVTATNYGDCAPTAGDSQPCGTLCFTFLSSTSSQYERNNVRWKCVGPDEACCCSVNGGASYFGYRKPQQDTCFPPTTTAAPIQHNCVSDDCRDFCGSIYLLYYSCNAPDKPTNTCYVYSQQRKKWYSQDDAQYYHDTEPDFY